MSDKFRDAAGPAVGGESFRELLAAERAATLAQITALSREFEGIVAANAFVAVDDEHDPEGSSTAFERAHVASMLDRARKHLTELDQASARLEQGDYGMCMKCGEPIPKERLEARPASTMCVRCAASGPR
ncbi:TraR/DksA C4-type zinc finger protein [Streptomyces sp. NPDC004589]|uniref:TraR/DksA family transcriptional regulator n=1 Tax=Streptomyces sp. NPDC004589 TaxID=3154553 RepID=UPI0033AD02A2